MKTGYIELFENVWVVKEIKSKKLGSGIMIDFTGSNDPEILDYQKLTMIAEMFDTVDIDWNNIAERGFCDTCDYGSRYGTELRIYNIKRKYEMIKWDK